jgi:hypothetical protein
MHANLSYAHFDEASLSDANLSRADLRHADLDLANLSFAWLISADLSDARLIGAHLREAKLHRAILTAVNLRDANLFGADLSDADLSGADLFMARLNGADLRLANLTDANLTDANLRHAYLAGANLRRANLTKVMLGETVFGATDLSEAKGLGACRHDQASIIDHSTLQRSGQLPLNFLRGCGLPDNLIDYLPSLLNQPIQFYSCFISYSSQDDEFARRLHADLQNNGVRCWFAPEEMRIGDRIRTRIDEVIRFHEKLLLVLSANSINSDWVEKEVETAFEKERETKSTVLFPVRLDDAVMHGKTGWAANIKRTRHIGDFRRWKEHDAYSQAFERLLRALKVELTT